MDIEVVVPLVAIGVLVVLAATYVGIKADVNFDRSQFLGDIRHRNAPVPQRAVAVRQLVGRLVDGFKALIRR